MESTWHRAWRDTERFRHTPLFFWGLEVAGAAILGFGGGYLGFLMIPVPNTQTQSYLYPAIGVVIGVIVGSIVVFILIYTWNLFSASYRQRNELIKKVKELEVEKIPHILVIPVTGKRQADYEKTERLMWAELQVKNISTKELKDVQVNIIKCLSIQEKQDSSSHNDFVMWDFLKIKPFCVYWSERQTQPKQMSLIIPSDATRSALIAFQDNSNGGNFNFNTPLYHWIVGRVKIDVEISDYEAVLWRGDFYIECHPNYYKGEKAKFEFIEWNKWVSSRNIVLLDSNKC